ncbi:MAG: hypothetical protein QOI24_2833 [Acidobacteriota bacterium]|jgi:hypothetical protein|nr:hypothetical protein [Acidobacteriota bacterium]
MHYAGLARLRVSLTGSIDGQIEDGAYDKRTAGWFAGIKNGRAIFGVMAHEVAHDGRNERHCVAGAREREELLTDLTTIYLGFGVLSTNSTDRYRSSGGYGYTSWSVSSVGYLPPNAMAWLLALQATARDDRDEQRAIERHLEPNQKACFRAAMSELANEASWIEALRLPPRDTWPARAPLTPATIVEPDEDEVAEPPSCERNRGRTIRRLAGTSWVRIGLVGLDGGAAIGAVFSPQFFSERQRLG